MNRAPTFDIVAAHRYFAAHCFNGAWDLIEKQDRTVAEDRLMVVLSQASIYHWSQHPDCDDQKLAVGYWQASRVQSLVGNAAEAARLGAICLSHSHDLPPFFLAYAHEALARAHHGLGEADVAARHLAAARELLPLVKEQADRDRLGGDLDEIG